MTKVVEVTEMMTGSSDWPLLSLRMDLLSGKGMGMGMEMEMGMERDEDREEDRDGDGDYTLINIRL